MADTRVQSKVVDWIRKEWMPANLGETFHRDRVQLRSGGVFDFDAVNADGSVIANISTSAGKTAGGKHGVGKLMKLRADMLFLTMVQAKRRLMILSEKDMYELCLKEKAGGRVPPEIEFLHAQIPAELAVELTLARAKAAMEVMPGQSASGMPPN